MKKSFIKLLKILGETAVIILVLLAVILGVTRSLLPYIEDYRGYVETWASNAVHQPVTFGKIQANWQGIHPVFVLTDVTVLNRTKTISLLNAQHVEIHVNVLASLLSRTIKPSLVQIEGTHLSIRPLADNTFDINGIKTPLDLGNLGGSHNDVQAILVWLLSQGQIGLNEVDVDWYGRNGLMLSLSDLHIQLNKGLFKRQLSGIGKLGNKAATHFQFVVDIKGDIHDIPAINANIYLKIKKLELAPWLHKKTLGGFSWVAGNLRDLELWAGWHDSGFQQIQSIFHLGPSTVSSAAVDKKLAIDKLTANVAWQRDKVGWRLAADQIQLSLNAQPWPIHEIAIHTMPTHSDHFTQIIRADSIEIAQVANLLLASSFITPPTKEILAGIQPQGQLKTLLLRRDALGLPTETYFTYFDFKEVDWLPWKRLPGVEKISGKLQASSNMGEVQLDGRNLALLFKGIFRQPIVLDSYEGQIRWLKTDEGWRIRTRNWLAQNSTLSIRGNMDLLLPRDGGSPFIRLLMGFAQHDINRLRDYLPVGILSPKLSSWLEQAFVKGEGADGTVLLQGPLHQFPFDDHTGHFAVSTKTYHVDLNYKAGWPILQDLSAALSFDNASMKIEAPYAKILSVTTQPLYAEISNFHKPELKVLAGADMAASEGVQFIHESPLETSLGKTFTFLDLKGRVTLGLKLIIPLYANGATTVDGDVHFQPNTSLVLPNWNIMFDQLAGDLHFTEKSLDGHQLQANWLGQPVAIAISTQPNAAGITTTQFKVTGPMSVAALQQAYGMSFLTNVVQGNTNYLVTLEQSKKNEKTNTTLTFVSDLKGITLNLPASLGKIAGDEAPTLVAATTNDDLLNITARYAKKLNAALTFQSNTKQELNFKSGELRFGDTPAVFQQKPGLLVTGNLPHLVWSEIQTYLTSTVKAKNSGEPAKAAMHMPLSVRQIDLSIGSLDAFGLHLQQARVQAQPLVNAWSVAVNSPSLQGGLLIPNDLNRQAIQGDFQRFYYAPGTSSKAVADLRPGNIPGLNLKFQNFYYGQKSLGTLLLLTSSQKNALQINKFSLVEPGFNLLATGQWQEMGLRGQQTTLNGNFNSANLGAVLVAWQLTNSLVETEGSAHFALSWPGAAYNLNPNQLNGQFSLDFKNGRILNISSQSDIGIGRILNLFSLQTLPRRLSLDFSDLFKEGFAFDAMKGNFIVKNGNVTTNDAFLNGPIARVDIKGRIGLGAKDYDLTMITTPYVTSSLPVALAIAGGPAVGAAAWIANKIFGGVVNKITGHTYRVTGSWDNPVVVKI